MARLEQITISLPLELRIFVGRVAAQESRTVAAQVRHFVVLEAARHKNGADLAAPEPMNWPAAPTLAHTPEGVAEAQAQLAAWRPEYASLRKLLANPNGAWTGEHEQRCMWLRDAIPTLENELKIALRMMKGA